MADTNRFKGNFSFYRFSQFFISPCFDADSTNRELNAIDSEHQKNILIDSRRIYQIDKITSKEGHVYQKFGTGTKNIYLISVHLKRVLVIFCRNASQLYHGQPLLFEIWLYSYNLTLCNVILLEAQDIEVETIKC